MPISSSAHLTIIPAFLGWEDPGLSFSAVLHLSTLLTVLIYFRKDLWNIGYGSIDSSRPEESRAESRRVLSAILIGTLPIGILGLTFKHFIEANLRTLQVTSVSLIVLAVLLAVSEKKGTRSKRFADLSFWQLQIIGLAQALALIPGVSRSGVCLTAGLFIALRRDEAAKFAFLLGIPAISAAGLLELLDLWKEGISAEMVTAVIVGSITSFVAGWLAIDGLIRYLKSHSTYVFVYYRVALGIMILGLLFSGYLQ